MIKKKLMMLGPPGAGKGTQAKLLSKEHDLAHISTGDMLRRAKEQGTELGKKAASYMNEGELVPDEVVIGIVRETLSDPEIAEGFILDGFPRTVEQAEALERMGIELDTVLNVVVDEPTIIERLSGRRSCTSCGETYHIQYNPPQREGVCDVCGEELVQRADDQPDAIRTRLEEYHAKTAPLIAFYRDRDKLIDIDGEQSPEEVEEQIQGVLR